MFLHKKIGTRYGSQAALDRGFGKKKVSNILNGNNVRLYSAQHGMEQANMDLGFFQYTKVTVGVYMRVSIGYTMISENVVIRRQGGVGLSYRKLPLLKVDAFQHFSPNVISLYLVLGGGGGTWWDITWPQPTPLSSRSSLWTYLSSPVASICWWMAT